MEDIIRSVISEFIKKDASSIDASTIIDKSAVKSSILVHRMYGALANAGIRITDYLTIKTYGELLSRLNGNVVTQIKLPGSENEDNSEREETSGIGIDIENAQRLPVSADYRDDEFYRLNFTAREISYCSLQGNSNLSFTGLFAAKEAIVKASRRFKGTPFNQIEIDHDVLGKPLCPGFDISISYLDNVVVAVAVHQFNPASGDNLTQAMSASLKTALREIDILKKSVSRYALLFIISLLVAFSAIGLLLFSH